LLLHMLMWSWRCLSLCRPTPVGSSASQKRRMKWMRSLMLWVGVALRHILKPELKLKLKLKPQLFMGGMLEGRDEEKRDLQPA
jgi:hypothetical protein